MKLKRNLYRDMIALGSWVMFSLVLVRSLIEPYRPFADQMVIAGVLLVIAEIVLKEYDGYSARGIVMSIFTSFFYLDIPFTIFVSVVCFTIIYSSIKIQKTKKVVFGIIVGLIASLVGYLLSNFSILFFQ